MRTLKYTFWRDGEFFLGYIKDYSGYQTQAYSKDELVETIKDLLTDIESGKVPFIKTIS